MADLVQIHGLKTFQTRLSKIAKSLPEEQILIFHKRVALGIFRRAIARTPVDTGRARGGWILSVGAGSNAIPAEGVVEVGPKPPPGDASGGTFERGLAALESLKPFGVVYIQNNVEYIGLLEEGGSSQARAGMIGPAVREMSLAFRNG